MMRADGNIGQAGYRPETDATAVSGQPAATQPEVVFPRALAGPGPGLADLIAFHPLIAHAAGRLPDLDIGPGHIHRWILRASDEQGAVYLHRILNGAPVPDPHDHAGHNVTIVLRGAYRERLDLDPEAPLIRRAAGDMVFRQADQPHRIVDADPIQGAWTLWLRSPRLREWGFHCPGKGFVPWTQYVDPDDPARVGPGCGSGAPDSADLGDSLDDLEDGI